MTQALNRQLFVLLFTRPSIHDLACQSLQLHNFGDFLRLLLRFGLILLLGRLRMLGLFVFLMLLMVIMLSGLRVQVNLYGLIQDHGGVDVGLALTEVILLVLGVYFEVVLHFFLVIRILLLQFSVLGVLLHVGIFASVLTEVKESLYLEQVLSHAQILKIVYQHSHEPPDGPRIPPRDMDGAEGVVGRVLDVAVGPQPEEQLDAAQAKAHKIHEGVHVEAVQK